jgi:hypothetical protein
MKTNQESEKEINYCADDSDSNGDKRNGNKIPCAAAILTPNVESHYANGRYEATKTHGIIGKVGRWRRPKALPGNQRKNRDACCEDLARAGYDWRERSKQICRVAPHVI